MKPRRCRAILLQKVDPIGFFNSRQNIGIGISTCKNVLVDLESCVGMFCWIILSPKRLQGKFLRHYTYSDWLNWIYSPAPDRLQYLGLVKLRQPYLNHKYKMYCTGVTWTCVIAMKINSSSASIWIYRLLKSELRSESCCNLSFTKAEARCFCSQRTSS